jgi:hypothetical protein
MAQHCGSSPFANLSPDEVAVLAVVLAIALVKNLDEPSIYVLASFFIALGGLLNVMGRQRDLLAALSTTVR